MRRAVGWVMLVATLFLRPAWSQEPPPPLPTAATTVEETKARLAELETLELPAPTKEQATQLYQEALGLLEKEQQHATRLAQLEAEAAGATDRVTELEARRAAVPPQPTDLPGPEASANAVKEALTQAEAGLATLTSQLTAARQELTAAQESRKTLGDRIPAAKAKATELRGRLDLPLPDEEPPQVGPARLTARQARVRAAEREVEALEKELSTFETRLKVLTLTPEVLASEERAARKRVEALRQLLDERRRQEAEAERRRAQEQKEALASAHPAVQALAQETLDLTTLRTGPGGLLARLEELTGQTTAAEARLKRLTDDLTDVEERLDAVGLTDTIGSFLRRQRSELPDVRALRREIRERQKEIRTVQDRTIQLRRQARAETPEEEVARILDSLDPQPDEDSLPYVEQSVRELVGQKRDLQQKVAADTRALYTQLQGLDDLQRQLISQTEAFTSFIDEHVLWIRSADPLGRKDVANLPEAVAWLTNMHEWGELVRGFVQDMRDVPTLHAGAIAGLLLLLAWRRRARRQLQTLAGLLMDWRDDRMAYTWRAIAATMVISLPAPAFLCYVGWRLSAVITDAYPRGASVALLPVAAVLLFGEVLRQVCRRYGLGEAHFGWQPESLRALRRFLGLGMLIGLPLLFLVHLCEAQQVNEAYRASLGRIAFLALMVVTAILVGYLLRRGGTLLHALRAQDEKSVLLRTQGMWYTASLALPILLGILALLGYQFTAIQLSWRMLSTGLIVMGLVILQALVRRWLLVVQRQLRLRNLMEDREERHPASDAIAEFLGKDAPIRSPYSSLTLTGLNEETRILLRWALIGVGALALYLTWVDVLPALGILDSVQLWGATPEDPESAVTLVDLLQAVLLALVTVVAGRHLPAFLKLVLLTRLPLDEGAQYAVRALTSYTILLVGLILVAGQLGLSWSSVQWLAAALTLGLGFGLQEIFANFVSGLILLFERPVRVGDVITIGAVSGVVARISIRATIIRDFDRKELVVPNKEFITGHLMNWSLSDQVLRIIIPVGVAYGSDTVRARELLLQVATDCEYVLEKPSPEALFLSFGDSSLLLELRVFVGQVDHLLKARNELHGAIDEVFKAAGIEIAFPQRDLRLRSADVPLRVRLEPGEAPGGGAG